MKEWTKENLVVDRDLDIDTDAQTVTAYLETWFDVDEKFGLDTKDDDSVWVNLYASYHPNTGDLEMTYIVSGDYWSNDYPYTPTEGEKALVIGLMEETCQRENGCSMKELLETYIEEEMTL